MRYIHFLRNTKTFKTLLITLSVLGLLFQLLFSPWGNRILSPVIEASLSKTLSAPVTLHEFDLTYKRFNILFQDNLGNTIRTQGGFSLLTLRMYAHYRIECFQDGGINAAGFPFKSEGALSGGIASFTVHGNADIFQGNFLYGIEFRRFRLATLKLELRDIGYENLLHLFDYPSATDTTLSGNLELRGIDHRDVTGEIRLIAKTHIFKPTPIEPSGESTFDLREFLADRDGRIKPFKVDVSLLATLDNAGIFEQFAGHPLDGPIDLNATLSGDETHLAFSANSTIAESETSLQLKFFRLAPEQLRLDLSHANLKALFNLFALPAPVLGTIDMKGNLTPGDGTFTMRLTHASTLPEILKRDYNLTQPSMRFDAVVSADINPGKGVHYYGSFNSDLQRLSFENNTTHDQMLRELLKTFR